MTAAAPAASAMSAWLHPASRPEVIDNLVNGVDRYNPSNLPILVDYLYEQIQTGAYDCLANLAILKLYQFNPPSLVPSVVLHILLLALPHSSTTNDFSLALALLERPPASALLDPLLALSASLQSSNFPQFWAQLHALPAGSGVLTEDDDDASGGETGLRELAAEHVALVDNVRALVLRQVSAAFRSVGKDRLTRYLDFEGDDKGLEEYLAGKGWTVKGETVEVPPNADNEVKGVVVQERLGLQQLQKVVAQVQA